MRWIRLTFDDVTQLKFPDVCPNCLQSPATTITPIVRSSGVPFVAAFTTTGSWPFCLRCSTWVTRPTQWIKWFAVFPGVLLTGIALYVAFTSTDRGQGVNSAALLCLLSAIAVAVGGGIVVTLIHTYSKRPDSCISNFPTIKPIRSGTAILSRKKFAIFDFQNPLYVEALLAVNDLDNIKYSDKALIKAKQRFLDRFCPGMASHSDTIIKIKNVGE